MGSAPDPTVARSMAEILPLIGDRVLLLHPRRSSDRETGGGDVDLAVERLDPLWPLRLPPGWRLSQVLHYDVRGWYWVLDHAGETVALDTVDDPRGLGRDALPTRRLIELAGKYPDAAKAAYLTAKRVRKSIIEAEEWDRIGELTRSAPDAYRLALSWMFGRRLAERLETALMGGQAPTARLLREARRVQWLRRRRTPSLAIGSFWASAGRWCTRLTRPTGLFVVVAGPDGTGKTTLAAALPDACRGPFRRWMHVHWRPGFLPRAGSLVGAPLADPTRPHARTPHGMVGSLASLAYHWADFFIGGWLRFVPFKARTGLIVLERGYWDIAVDPRRYRIAAPARLVTMLGRLLPRPDLFLVLEAAPDVVMARKAEIEPAELERQTRAWREVLPRRPERAYIDASLPPDEVRAVAREAVFSALARRATGRLGPGWAGLPTRSAPRWMLPRGPRRSALSAFSIYQPVTLRGRSGWEAGRALAATGLFRVWPRGAGPPEAVRTIVAPFMPPRSTLAVLRPNHPHRFVAMILGHDGRPHAVAKVALDDAGRLALEAEAGNLVSFGRLLQPPLRAPRILDVAPGLLLLEAVRWSARARPWVLPPDVAHGLGLAYSASSDGDREVGMAHGDCAPWNLLRAPDGWVLVDWEGARADAPPFFDIAHYLVQGHSLLGRPTLRELLPDESERSWVRVAVRAYADGARRPASDWRSSLIGYLRTSAASLDPSIRDHARGLAGRERLLRALDG